jgi:hypothetical protein
MKFFYRSKLFTTLVLIILAILFFTECIHRDQKEMVVVNNHGEQFAGSAKCADCHKEICESFLHTAHNLTSGPALESTIKGSFNEGQNTFQYFYVSTIAMEKRDSGLYQVLYFQNKERLAMRFDVVIGSGTRGQSFGSWRNNRIFQLPVSYLTSAGTWCNSPGYPNYEPYFNRRITARCLECHSTYFKDISTPKHPQEFDRNQVIYGVQCESCHGAGEKHVEFQQQNPGEKKGKYIINPALFSRQQKLDLCSYCHNNTVKNDTHPFDFVPGDTLAKTAQPVNINKDSQSIDVHGNQYGLLTASKCFIMSGTMDCSTCHNTHQEERGKLELFSQRCMNCHREEKGNFCKMTLLPASVLKINCIDCHMPKKQSKTLTLALEGKPKNIPATLRSHLIAIYPSETQKYISLLQATSAKK